MNLFEIVAVVIGLGTIILMAFADIIITLDKGQSLAPPPASPPVALHPRHNTNGRIAA